MFSEPKWHGADQQQFTGHGSEREILREMDQRKGVGQKPWVDWKQRISYVTCYKQTIRVERGKKFFVESDKQRTIFSSVRINPWSVIGHGFPVSLDG